MTDRQMKALRALVSSSTRREAAEKAGISESTMRNYLLDPEFESEYERVLQSLVEDATSAAKMALSPALSTLMEIVEDVTENAPTRVSAARAALEFSLKVIEKTELQKKLAELEAVLRELEEGRRE